MSEPRVPKISIDTSSVPATDRLELWSRIIPTHTLTLPEGVTDFSARDDSWLLGEVILTKSQISPLRCVRTFTQVRTDGLNHIIFMLLKKGLAIGEMSDTPFTAGDGEIFMQSLSRTLAIESTEMETISLRMPRAMIKRSEADIDDLHGAVFAGPIARLLANHMQLLVTTLDELDVTSTQAMSDSLVQLVQTAITAQFGERDEQARKLGDNTYRIRRYIDDHLTSNTLGPAEISKAIGMSRSSLYRAFASSNGISAHIKRRRLEATHVRLNDPDEKRSITEIAYEYGFATSAHFSRAFREEYGYSPRQARGSGNPFDVTDGDPEALAVYRRWLAQIPR